jgi:hypothetical protein
MIFLSIVIGFIIGWLALKLLINRRLKIMLESIAYSPLPEKKEPKKVDIDLVKIKDVIYAYSRDEPQFLAQGTTKEEIAENLKIRFPDTSFMASPKNLREVGLDESI